MIVGLSIGHVRPAEGAQIAVGAERRKPPGESATDDINTAALTVVCLRVAQSLSSWAPETEAEKAFLSRFRERYSVEQREAALDATLNYFVGGTLEGVLETLRKQNARRRQPIQGLKQRRWREI